MNLEIHYDKNFDFHPDLSFIANVFFLWFVIQESLLLSVGDFFYDLCTSHQIIIQREIERDLD